MRFLIKTPFYHILLFFFASSCTKVDRDCGCAGSTYRTIESLQAGYSGNGLFIVADTTGGYLYVSACDVNSSWEVSQNKQTLNYTISGNVKRRCPGPHPELELPAPGGPIQITSIKKN
ncbi:hypothetical protein [Runella sp.]|uniref:hypothetical protein n=1 Tax=Runella sp. TaxID=1960881 RepID=UPI003D0F0815